MRSLRQLLAQAQTKKDEQSADTAPLSTPSTVLLDNDMTVDITAGQASSAAPTADLDAPVTIELTPPNGTFVSVGACFVTSSASSSIASATAALTPSKPSSVITAFTATQAGRLLLPNQTGSLSRLEDQSRVIVQHPQATDTNNNTDDCLVQIQVWHGGQWLVVMEYVVCEQPVLNVHSLSGAKREIKILLPASAVKSMALNDLSSNRLEYSRRFLLGRKILL